MLFLVTGASGSGKSEYAERLAVESPGFPRIYLAAMMVWDEEGRQRVSRHQAMRAAKDFITVERHYDLEGFKPESSNAVILLECMSNLVSNEYWREKEGTEDRILRGIRSLNQRCQDLIVVTNEVFSDGVCYDPETEDYIRILGAVNCRLGRLAGCVAEVVCGCPVNIKAQGDEG